MHSYIGFMHEGKQNVEKKQDESLMRLQTNKDFDSPFERLLLINFYSKQSMLMDGFAAKAK